MMFRLNEGSYLFARTGDQSIDLFEVSKFRVMRMDAKNKNETEVMLGVIAHEVRSPLQAIITAANVIETHGVGGESLNRCVRIIIRQANFLGGVFDSLYLYAGIQSNRCLDQIEYVCFSDLIDQAIESCAPFGEMKRIKFYKECSSSGFIECLPVLVIQAIINLISNAIKFSSDGGQITIWSSSDRTCTRAHVRDSGRGMRQDQIDEIFHLFNRGGIKEGGGLGIGLYLSALFVKLHNGRISVSSDGVGCGAEFTIELPNIIMPGSSRQ